MCFEPFRGRAGWAIDKWLQVISTIMVFKQKL